MGNESFSPLLGGRNRRKESLFKNELKTILFRIIFGLFLIICFVIGYKCLPKAKIAKNYFVRGNIANVAMKAVEFGKLKDLWEVNEKPKIDQNYLIFDFEKPSNKIEIPMTLSPNPEFMDLRLKLRQVEVPLSSYTSPSICGPKAFSVFESIHPKMKSKVFTDEKDFQRAIAILLWTFSDPSRFDSCRSHALPLMHSVYLTVNSNGANTAISSKTLGDIYQSLSNLPDISQSNNSTSLKDLSSLGSRSVIEKNMHITPPTFSKHENPSITFAVDPDPYKSAPIGANLPPLPEPLPNYLATSNLPSVEILSNCGMQLNKDTLSLVIKNREAFQKSMTPRNYHHTSRFESIGARSRNIQKRFSSRIVFGVDGATNFANVIPPESRNKFTDKNWMEIDALISSLAGTSSVSDSIWNEKGVDRVSLVLDEATEAINRPDWIWSLNCRTLLSRADIEPSRIASFLSRKTASQKDLLRSPLREKSSVDSIVRALANSANPFSDPRVFAEAISVPVSRTSSVLDKISRIVLGTGFVGSEVLDINSLIKERLTLNSTKLSEIEKNELESAIANEFYDSKNFRASSKPVTLEERKNMLNSIRDSLFSSSNLASAQVSNIDAVIKIKDEDLLNMIQSSSTHVTVGELAGSLVKPLHIAIEEVIPLITNTIQETQKFDFRRNNPLERSEVPPPSYLSQIGFIWRMKQLLAGNAAGWSSRIPTSPSIHSPLTVEGIPDFSSAGAFTRNDIESMRILLAIRRFPVKSKSFAQSESSKAISTALAVQIMLPSVLLAALISPSNDIYDPSLLVASRVVSSFGREETQLSPPISREVQTVRLLHGSFSALPPSYSLTANLVTPESSQLSKFLQSSKIRNALAITLEECANDSASCVQASDRLAETINMRMIIHGSQAWPDDMIEADEWDKEVLNWEEIQSATLMNSIKELLEKKDDFNIKMSPALNAEESEMIRSRGEIQSDFLDYSNDIKLENIFNFRSFRKQNRSRNDSGYYLSNMDGKNSQTLDKNDDEDLDDIFMSESKYSSNYQQKEGNNNNERENKHNIRGRDFEPFPEVDLDYIHHNSLNNNQKNDVSRSSLIRGRI